jgi:serine phosphatase RsbU (regulator of sigma subunit)
MTDDGSEVEPVDTWHPNYQQLGRALEAMLRVAHTIPPDELPRLGHASGAVPGLRATNIFLADYSGRRLVPFGGTVEDSILVDGTVAGRAFAQGESLEVRQGDAVTLWAPLVDGVDRIGVAGFELDEIDDERRGVLAMVAALLATETISRGQYTDAVTQTRRLKPMTLPSEVQWSLLPPRSFATPDVCIAAALEPSYSVAGDAFDYAYGNGVLRAAVFDAMGHDLPATLICGLCIGAYRYARRRGAGLTATVLELDRIVSENVPDNSFATALFADLDAATGVLTYVNAGHPPPMLLRDGHVVGPLEGGRRLPLGLGSFLEAPFAEGVVRLQPDDRVVLYTDGIVEAHSAGGADFGAERLGDFVCTQLASGLADTEVIRRVIHAVVDHYGGRLNDDATVVLVHWRPAQQS